MMVWSRQELYIDEKGWELKNNYENELNFKENHHIFTIYNFYIIAGRKTKIYNDEDEGVMEMH